MTSTFCRIIFLSVLSGLVAACAMTAEQQAQSRRRAMRGPRPPGSTPRLTTIVSLACRASATCACNGGTRSWSNGRRRPTADRSDMPVWWQQRPRARSVSEAGCADNLVPRRGLEPPRLSPLVPETSASTNSATWALERIGKVGPFPCQMAARVAVGPVQLPAPILYSRRNTALHPPFHIEPSAHGKPARHHPGQCRQADHRLWRLGFPRPPCDPRALQARLPHPRRGAAAGARRPPATARPGRPDPRGAGEPALPGLGRGGGARRRRGDQPGRHPVRARPPALRRGAGVRRRIGRAGGVGLRRAAGARLRDRRRRERDLGLCPRQGHRREARVRRQTRRRRCCGRRWCSGRKTISSTALRRWPASRRRCRWSAAGIRDSSRSMWATSPPPWSRRSRAAPRRAASTSSAAPR